MSDPWQDLDALRHHLWARLARGAAHADDPFRLVALATTGADGPEARMVALRAADPSRQQVELHTDARTAKVKALDADARAALLLWDAATQEQLRLSLAVTLIPADSTRWAGIPPDARLNYGTDPAPGTALSDPDTLTRRPDIKRHVALLGEVRAMDAVSLAHAPHRRARFTPAGADWIAP